MVSEMRRPDQSDSRLSPDTRCERSRKAGAMRAGRFMLPGCGKRAININNSLAYMH